MKLQGNTLLITGGASGIGRGLAEAFHARGNRVVIAGRRVDLLKQVAAQHPGMAWAELDIADGASIEPFVQELLRQHPSLNGVIHNAGIMRAERLQDGQIADAEAHVAINLLGPIRLSAALLPHLLKQERATLMTVSSGLAFVPLASTPTYCATKAAIHSYTQSLRYQLKDTPVQVIELAPPYLQTELMGSFQARDPHAMPLQDFINEAMALLEATPNAEEVLVERVKPQRLAESSGNYAGFYKQFNDALASRFLST